MIRSGASSGTGRKTWYIFVAVIIVAVIYVLWMIPRTSLLMTMKHESLEDSISDRQKSNFRSDPISFKVVEQSQNRSNVAHVVLIGDRNASPGILTLIYSIMKNSKTNVNIYVLTNNRDYAEIKGKVDCISPTNNTLIAVIKFELPQDIMDLIVVHSSKHQYLKSSENFARFFLADVLVELDYVLYLDCDVVVQGDVGVLWREVYRTHQLMTAAKGGRIKVSKKTSALYKERYGRSINKNASEFNGGVAGYNLNKWRQMNMTKEVVFWMSSNKKWRLWALGTQPIMNVLVAEDVKFFNKSWNFRMLQKSHSTHTAKLSLYKKAKKSANILHYNGKCKPWQPCRADEEQEWIDLWSRYDRGVCSDEGKCVLMNNAGICECNDNHYGQYCEKT